jgi:hypothetical protein
MKALYPRTAGELAEHSRWVILRCEGCGHNEVLDPQLVVFTFGDDFDLFDGFAEVGSRLSCSRCGAPRPAIRFHDPDHEHFEPVSYEEALASSLELSAFARARDADEPVRVHAGRVRKSGGDNARYPSRHG